MSFLSLPYTYGSKTLTEINALTGMVEGETVFNTTWDVIEIYNGVSWVNDQGELWRKSAEYDSPQVGDCVQQDTNNQLLLSTGSSIQDFLGVVSRVTGTNCFVTHMGKYSVLVDYDEDPSGVTTGKPLSISGADDGRVKVDTSPSGSSGLGIIGYAMETVSNSGTEDYLVKIALQTVEMY